MSRHKVWRGIPHPKSFATGVALSALIGSASVAYSAIYTPYVAPPKVPYSWDVDSADRKHVWDAPPWLASPGDDFFRYRSRIYRSSAIMNMTQAPDWAAMWWVIPKWREGELFARGDTIPYMQVHIARDPDSREVLSEDEQEPYGMKTRSTSVDQPIALLRRAAEKQ